MAWPCSAGLAGALYATRFTPLKVAWSGSTLLPAVIVAAAVMTAVGTLEDVREVSAPAKFAGQILAGSVLVFFGVALLYLRVPFTKEFVVLTRDVAPIATVVWVMGMTKRLRFSSSASTRCAAGRSNPRMWDR